MPRSLLRVLLFCLPLVFAANFAGSADSYKLDPVHSTVVFKIKYLGTFWFQGRFNEINGKVLFDEKTPENSRVSFVVNAESIDTASDARDSHLKSKDYFNTKVYPAITFVSDSVKRTGKDTFDVKGNLTLLGVTKPLTVAAVFEGKGRDLKGMERIGFQTTFTINRCEFGMTAGRMMVGDDVTLTITTVAAPSIA